MRRRGHTSIKGDKNNMKIGSQGTTDELIKGCWYHACKAYGTEKYLFGIYSCFLKVLIKSSFLLLAKIDLDFSSGFSC